MAEKIDTTTGEVTGDSPIKVLYVPKGVLAVGRISGAEDKGVQILRDKDGHMRAAATDGVRCLIVEWSDDHLPLNAGEVCLIPSELATKAEKEIPGKGTQDVMQAMVQVNEAAPDGQPNLSLHMQRPGESTVVIGGTQIKDQFPDLWPLFGKEWPCKASVLTRLDVTLLADLLKTMQAVGADDVEIAVPLDGKKPVQFQTITEDCRKIKAVMAPRHVEEDDQAKERKAVG